MYRKDGLTYVMVNVFGSKHGYSFMVTTNDEHILEDNVLNSCQEKGLFSDADDIHLASIETIVNENDVQFFSNATYNID